MTAASPFTQSCSQWDHLRWILSLSSTENRLCVWCSVTNTVAHCPKAFNCVREPQTFFVQQGLWQYSSDCGFGQTIALWFEPLGQWLLPQQTFWLCVLMTEMEAWADINILLMNHSRLGLVVFVCGRVAVDVFYSLSLAPCSFFFLWNAFVNPLIFDAERAWKYQVHKLYLPHCLPFFVCMSFQFPVANNSTT